MAYRSEVEECVDETEEDTDGRPEEQHDEVALVVEADAVGSEEAVVVAF